MKRFLEGKGWAVDNKFGEVGVIFQDAIVILTSNSIPHDRLPIIDKEALNERV